MENDLESVLILDFGSQYTQLIARKIRELGVYSLIVPHIIVPEKIGHYAPKGIIFSGSPQSVYSENALLPHKGVFSLGIPVLGICYGLQIIARHFGGKVTPSKEREYGKAMLEVVKSSPLFRGFPQGEKSVAWMSHGDKVEQIPHRFHVIATTNNSPFAAIADETEHIYGVQFHPEVAHTEKGKDILRNFLVEICGFKRTWSIGSFIEREIQAIRERVKEKKVICALSGGVDSSVVAALLGRAIGKDTKAIFINNGLLRKDEEEEVIDSFTDGFDFDLIYVDAKQRFLDRLAGITDPEKKRKTVGNLFIEIFEEKARELGDIEFLAQGTLYPDVIESKSFRGPSATIKTHHNVGGLPEKMKLKLIEPLRELFKDETRRLGSILGIPKTILERHPFPGPGLAVRIVGEITQERILILREADAIIVEEIKKANLYDKIWQAFGVLLPIKSVGVMGDERTYENVCVVRAVESLDAMTANWYRLPYELLEKLSTRIINEVKGINRVVYDISSKPPSTIEWE